MINVVIGLIVLGVVLFALRNTIRTMSGGGCGCGGGAPKKVKVADKNASNYSIEMDVEVGGMSCQNCAIHVENALNSLEGAWAQVDLKKNTAHLRLKNQVSEDEIRRVIKDAGYSVRAIRAC